MNIIDREIKKALLEIGFNCIGSYGKLEESEDGELWGEEWIEAMVVIARIEKHIIVPCDGGIMVVVGESDWLTISTKSDCWLKEDNEKLMSDEEAIALAKNTILRAIAAGIPGQLSLF